MRKNCLTCRHFKQSTEPPHMRGCMKPGKIEMNGAACGNWQNMYTFRDRVLVKLNLRKIPVRSLVQ